MNVRPKYVDICEASEANLNARETTNPAIGISKWMWSDLKNTAANTVSPQDTTLYYITAEGSNGCVAKDSIQVNVIKKPILRIDGGDEICVNDSITLRATSLLNDVTNTALYKWYSLRQGNTTELSSANHAMGGSGTDSLIVTHNTPSAIGSDDYMYRLEGTNQYGCKSFVDKQVVVRDNPSPIIPDLTPVCKGDNVIVYIYGADSTKVLEESNAKLEKIPYSASITTPRDSIHVITINHYNSVTCTTKVVKPVRMDSVPGIRITGDTEICSGGSITLTATDTTSYDSYQETITKTYSWTDANHTTTAQMTAQPNTTTTYGVTITNSKNCSASKDIDVTINPLPRVIAEANNGKVCPNGTDTLKAYIIENGTRVASLNSQLAAGGASGFWSTKRLYFSAVSAAFS